MSTALDVKWAMHWLPGTASRFGQWLDHTRPVTPGRADDGLR